MYLDKDQISFENKSPTKTLKYMNLLFAPILWREKNCVYLTSQFINWLSFLYNSQLNFVLSGFSYGEQYNDT